MANFTWYQDLTGLKFTEGTQSWIQLARVGEYKHPMYGDLNFTPQKLQEFADNFKKNVRGIDIDIDYSHKADPARGTEAAGWLRKVEFDGTVLKGLVEWTQTAAEKIKEKAFKYFSPEFRDTWTDEHGTKHNNVLFGGGITNRPFLKDLLPINLSELSFQDDPALPKENEVDPKQLRASIGLAEDATDEQVTERLGLIKTLSEAFPNGAPTPPKNDPPTPPAPPAPVFDFGGDIKQLAENNPQVAALVRFVESTVQQNQENAKKLVEQNVTMKLNEFDNSKLALTPVARDQVTALMLDEAMTPALRDKVWALMENMRNQSKFFVELGERSAYATHSRGVSGTTATQKYEGLVRQLMETDKIGYADAVVRISGDHPQLFEDYRAESTAWVE